MPRRSGRALTFRDAVRILDGDSPFIRGLDELLTHVFDLVPGGKLLGLPYFAFRSKIVEYGNGVVSGIHDRLHGLGRYDRTQRLLAAHAVIAMTAFSEALGELLGGAEVRIASSVRSPAKALTDDRRSRFLWFDSSVPEPAPGWGAESRLDAIHAFCATLVAEIPAYLTDMGLRTVASIAEELPPLAERRYEEYFRRLVAEVPEFAAWAYLAGQAATHATVEELGGHLSARLDTLTTGMAGIPELLERVSGRAAANQVRTDLAHAYDSALTRSVLGDTRAPEGIVLPSLERGYVNPACRAAKFDAGARPSEDSWWSALPRYDDMQKLLVGVLTAPDALEKPLVILGQPGAGKSVLTRVLAARLADRGFLPVRVELRNVPAAAEIQTQIECAIRDATGRSTDWPELSDSARADGLLPLVLLDGFDELLQATGVNRSDYLEQVARFQLRELDLGRPVAALVTSRTAVADRASFLKDGMTLRLEPFNEERVRTWLGVWNDANAAPLAARGVTPLDAGVLLRYDELVEQPLLLILLALYDADAGALQAAEADLGRAELYDRLLADFARREVRKDAAGLDAEHERRAVAAEVNQLSIVALSMFNRHAQVVTGAQLDYDLVALLPAGSIGESPDGRNGLAKSLTAAQLTIGRFFFVHESRALRDGNTEHAYEFLHATFGEFLTARYVVETLRTMAKDWAYFLDSGRSVPRNDSALWAALSFAALTGSAATVEFTEGLLARLPDDERVAVRELTIELLKSALYGSADRKITDYEPDQIPVFKRHSYYSANLAVLTVLSTGEPLDFHPIDTGVWPEALRFDEFRGLRDTVRVLSAPDDNGYDMRIEREDGSLVNPHEFGLQRRAHGVSLDRPARLFSASAYSAQSEAGELIRRSGFSRDWDWSLAALVSYFEFVGEDVDSDYDDGGVFVSPARGLLELRLAPVASDSVAHRRRLYQWCIDVAEDSRNSRWLNILFRQLREDAREMAPPIVAGLLIYALDGGALAIAPDGYRDVLLALRDRDVEEFRWVVEQVKMHVDGIPDAEIRDRLELFIDAF